MTDPLKKLVRGYIDETVTATELAELEQLLKNDAAARELFLREINLHGALEDFALRENLSDELEKDAEPTNSHVANRVFNRDQKSRVARWPFVFAAVASVLALMATLYFTRPVEVLTIARISGLSGSLQWTGNDGRVVHDLLVGSPVSGGTIEGIAPDSWFELTFNDGSTVTISGDSMLTFSDQGQKKLHLKEGILSGNVQPQPASKPMLIYTRSALLEVLGTQFGVEAEPWSTVLNVSEGKVRFKRLSDGNTVDVSAHHRAIAADGRELVSERVPESIAQWKTNLRRGPENTLGDWIAGTEQTPARLKAVPFSVPDGKTIYAAGIGVSCGDTPPVLLETTSRIRVRGKINSAHLVYFGITVRQENGEFAGRFQTILPDTEFAADDAFEIVLEPNEYHLDPALAHLKEKLPANPFGLVVESVWCHTLYDQVGLEITEVELISAETEN